MVTHLRRHPRFLDETKVEVELEDRKQLEQLWAVDISKGGMFLRTESPPPHGTGLEIRLSTPDGGLALKARVVHVVDGTMAKTFSLTPGIGVQFINLSQHLRERIELYVDGVAARLTLDLTADVETEPLEVLLDQARRIADAFAASDIYAALGVEPDATHEEIQERVEELCNKFAHPPSDASPPKAARLAQVARQIDRAASLFSNPLRRLNYDFNRGHLRVEERRAAGEDFDYLRSVWSDTFPDRMATARELAKQAQQAEQESQYPRAAVLAEEALKHDPFNEALRRSQAQWRENKKGAAPVAPGVAPARGEPSPPPPPPSSDPGRLEQELLNMQRSMPPLSHHQLLGVPETATTIDIDRAYLARSRRYDPESMRGNVPNSVVGMAVVHQRRLELAYKTLNDSLLRHRYLAERGQRGPKSEAAAGSRDARAQNEAGLLYLRKREYAKARELFRSAMALDGATPEYKANFAWSLIADPNAERRRAFDEARPLLEEAIAAAPVKTDGDRRLRARFHYYLGRLLREQDEVAAAKEHFEKALDLDRTMTEVMTEMRLLDARTKPPVGGGLRSFFKK